MSDGSAAQAESAPPPAKHPTLWDRLAHTPLRDAWRGQWHARRTIDTSIAEANLPAPLAQLVKQVVRKTRLWKRERLEVAQELIAHFADGHEAGCDADELARQFGSIEQAARLIRRGKKRNRPRWWRAWIRTWQGIGCVALLCVLVYAWSALRVFSGSPLPRHDYLADLNREAIAVHADQRAWPKYRTALLALEKQPEIKGPMSRLPQADDAGWAQWSEYLDRNREALAAVREAASFPRLGYVASFRVNPEDHALWPEAAIDPQPNGPQMLIGVQLRQLSELRKLSHALNFDAILAASKGDGDRATSDLTAMLGLAQHTRETPVFIADLVSFAILAQMLHATATILHQWPEVLTDQQLQSLAHRMASFSGGGRLQARLEGERAFQCDFIQHAFTDDGDGNGRITDEGLELYNTMVSWSSTVAQEAGVTLASPAIAPLAALVVADRKAVTEEYDRLMDLVERDISKPLWAIDHFESDGEVQRYYSSPLLNTRYLGIGVLLPALSHAVITTEQTTQVRDAMLVAIALELYRRNHGEWPASLESLVPQWLPNVPRDRFDGNPLRYRLIDGEPVVYSIGTDRDDDGGRAAIAADGTGDQNVKRLYAHPPLDGDWILWPPEP
jgi:hypothetical protein